MQMQSMENVKRKSFLFLATNALGLMNFTAISQVLLFVKGRNNCLASKHLLVCTDFECTLTRFFHLHKKWCFSYSILCICIDQ